MTTLTRTLSLTALACAALSTGALAQPAPGGQRPERSAPTTRAEAQARAAEMFARMDANKDGKLDQADRAAREGERFARLDTNKDGSLSRDEFAAARKPREGAGEGQRMGRQGGEGHHGLMGGRKHGRGRMGAMIGRMADANKDGTVTRDEFLAAHVRRFDMIDANKDGTISAEERQTARSKMHERMQDMRARRGTAGNQPG